MATINPAYHSTTDSTDLTITLASLASSSSLVAGRESTVVDNVSPKYVDVEVKGQITTGTSPTAGRAINVYVYAPIKLVSSTYTYPIATTTALTGVNAAATFEIEQLNQLRIGAVITPNSTSNRAYSFRFNIAELFGDTVPMKWGVFVTHSTGVNLNATAGNHWITYTGITYTSA